MQPIEFVDFSGGMTENILQGDPRRYQFADNFWLTNDKKLQERDAIVANEFQIETPTPARIGGLFNFLSDKLLVAQMGRNLYYSDEINDTMTVIRGVDGNTALQGGNEYSQISYGEFNNTKIYLTSDGNSNKLGILPSKVHLDEDNVWVARTVGLPRAWVLGTTEDSLLAQAIALANALRTSFIAHMEDVYSATYAQAPIVYQTTKLHYSKDKYALSYLETQTLTGSDPALPDPLPTPASEATDEATLYTLCRALSLAYTAHINDAKKASFQDSVSPVPTAISYNLPDYHWYASLWDGEGDASAGSSFAKPPSGPHAVLNDVSTPDDIPQAVAQLNDIYTKWYWHRNGIWVHSSKNDPSALGLHDPTVGKITSTRTGNTYPLITPDFTDLFNYANNLRHIWHGHIGVLGVSGSTPAQHTHFTSFNQITDSSGLYSYNLGLKCNLPECDDLDSFYLQTFWLRSLYYMHRQDALVADHVPITFSQTANSANITSVVRSDTGAAYTLPLRSFVYVTVDNFKKVDGDTIGTLSAQFATVIASGSGTATLDKQVTATTSRTGQASYSYYHLSVTSTDGSTFTGTVSTTSVEPGSTDLGYLPSEVGTDTASWLSLLNDFFTSMQAHAANYQSHAISVKGSGWNTSIANVPYPNFIPATISTAAYAFMFRHSYTVGAGGVEYETVGNPIFSDSTAIAVSYPVDHAPADQVNYTTALSWPVSYTNRQFTVTTTRANVISNLPVIMNTADTNYAVDDIVLEIYRTLDGGNTFFKVGEVDNGTTTFTDDINDTVPSPGGSALDDNTTLYTTGGRVAHDQPPQCKFMHIFNGTAYYGAITEAGQFLPNRIRQSVQRAPDGAPATFYDDLDDSLVGISSTRSNVIAVCKSSVYRMEGGVNEQGQGQITHEQIMEEIGGLNTASIVKTEIGVFFAGTDGFYYTDGYQNIKISLELDGIYAALTATENQKNAIFGSYDRLNRRVYWTMREAPDGAHNSIAYIFYLNYGVKPSGVFTRIKNDLNFRPASVAFGRKYGEKVMFVGDERGYMLRTDPWNKWDAVVSTTEDVEDWGKTHIPFNYTTCAIDLGNMYNRKWLTKMNLVGKNAGNVALQVNVIRDMNQTEQGPVPLAPINYTANATWGDPNWVWDDPEKTWKTDGKMDLWRRFPVNALRCNFLQLQFVPATTVIYASSSWPEFCTATVTNPGGGVKTVTIATPSGYTAIIWPLDVVGYYMSFPDDDYEAQYLISAVDEEELTLEDAGNDLALLSDVAWQITGVKKEQRLNITSLSVHYTVLDTETEDYPGAKTNDGPGNAGENPS